MPQRLALKPASASPMFNEQAPVYYVIVGVISMIIVIAGWLLIIANGKRPLDVKIKWLGLDVSISTTNERKEGSS